jgi:hypothetical protein
MNPVDTFRDGVEQANRTAERAARSRGVEALGRIGYGACGVLFVIIGVLAARVAFGAHAHSLDPRGALHTIAAQPLGTPLVFVVACGFAGLALWSLIQSIVDPRGRGTSAKGLFVRFIQFIVAAFWTVLAVGAFRIVFGSDMPKEGERDAAAVLLTQGWGPTAVVVIGAGIVAGGLGMLYVGVTGRFLEWEDLTTRKRTPKAAVKWLGIFGYAAKGLVLAISGAFVILAGVRARADEVRGFDGALAEVANRPYGMVMLFAVALGLLAFGAYSLVLAVYKKVTW